MVVGVEAGTVTDPISGNVDTAIAGLYGTLVVHADGSWVYVQDLGAPQTGDPTTDVFSYTMADAAGATSTTTLTIDLNGGANQAPTAVDDTVSVVPGQSAVLDILTNDSDPDRDSLAIASVTAPTQGTAELRDADGDGRVDLVYTARTDARGTDSFTYTIDDGHGHTATAAVTVEFPAQGSVSGGDGPSSGTSPTTGGSGSTPVTGTTGDPTATPIGSGGSTTTTTTAGQATATAANDHFVYHLGDGPLTIAGFEPGSQGQTADQIELAGFNLNFNSLDTNGDQRIDAMDANVSSDGAGGITLHLGNQDDLTVTHVTTLHQDDLLFS
jgi:VCBS repeat-containing protein